MTKNNKLTTILMAALMLGAAAGTSMAAEASLDAAVMSAYVWRGQVLNDEAVLQPSFTASSEWGLKLNAWGNMDLTDKHDLSGELNEIDLLIAYAPVWEAPVNLEVGFIEYAFPKEGNWEISLPDNHVVVADETLKGEDLDTRELYVIVGTDKIILAPTLSVYYDVDQVKDFYLNLGISHSLPLIEDTLSLDLAASIGYSGKDYNEYYFGSDSAALNDGNVSAKLGYSITESLSVAGVIQYTALLDSDVKDGAEAIYGDKDKLFGGVSASYGF